MNIDVKVPLPNGNEITLHCSGETLYEWQIREGWLKENPVIYWSDTEFYHWFFDFVIARKGVKDLDYVTFKENLEQLYKKMNIIPK